MLFQKHVSLNRGGDSDENYEDQCPDHEIARANCIFLYGCGMNIPVSNGCHDHKTVIQTYEVDWKLAFLI